MTTRQTPEPETPMEEAAEDAGGVSGMVNLTINLPDNIRISTVDSAEEETTVSNGNTTGMIQIFAGPTAPAGWLLCNGAAVSRATYSDLFDVIGTRYGVGNANTTFNLPDLRGRFPLGKDDMGEVSADRVTAAEADMLGGNGGEEDHEITIAEMPEHQHDIYFGDAGSGNNNNIRIRSETASFKNQGEPGTVRSNIHHNPTTPGLVVPEGSGAAHNNMPPFIAVHYIIKT
ncbi:MAG: tail fiber protein [Anaerolineaceae bacterium]|nr:tail fiber protein [Anaerolineaceae bacterium]